MTTKPFPSNEALAKFIRERAVEYEAAMAVLQREGASKSVIRVYELLRNAWAQAAEFVLVSEIDETVEYEAWLTLNTWVQDDDSIDFQKPRARPEGKPIDPREKPVPVAADPKPVDPKPIKT